MSEDNKRLNLDADLDLEAIKSNLLKDVEAATQAAKQRQHEEKTRDARAKAKAEDKNLKIAIIGGATVVLLLISYWFVFIKPGVAQDSAVGKPKLPPTGINRNQPSAVYKPPVQPAPMPNGGAVRRNTPPASEPVRRTPNDTYDEGPAPGGGM